MASPAEAVVVTTKTLTGLDIGIIAVYFVIIFGIGVYFARQGRSSVDYFLAGRNVGWFAIGASLFVLEHLHRALHRPRRLRRHPRASPSATSSGSRA